MKKNLRLLPVCLLLVPALLLASCAGASGGREKSAVERLNDKIEAIDTGLGGFSDVASVCAAFDGAFDGLRALGGADGVYVDQLENKCVGFYNNYLILSEESDEAASVVGAIFSVEISDRLARLLLNADKRGALTLDEDAFLDLVAAVSQDYGAFTALSADNSYFTAGKHAYADYKVKVETALFSLNGAFDYYNANVIDSDEKRTAFKRYFSDSIDAMADVARMHSETLAAVGEDAGLVLAFVERMKTVLPDESLTGSSR